VDKTLGLGGIKKVRNTIFHISLCGGMKQRVVIAMALVCEPT
jgi:ABC-type dipeptide/oligopeptide/nickel transport system ATPase component